MIKIKNYKKVENLEEAWELNQKRTNRIIGGMLCVKMSDANVQTAIDLSGLWGWIRSKRQKRSSGSAAWSRFVRWNCMKDCLIIQKAQ